jgi:hypothetical protein
MGTSLLYINMFELETRCSRVYCAGVCLTTRQFGEVERERVWYTYGYVAEALSEIQYCIPHEQEEIVRYS